MMHPSLQYGDLDSLQDVRKVPELLDFAESNLEAETPRVDWSPKPQELRGKNYTDREIVEPAEPIIMKNRLFMKKISKQLSVIPT